MANERTTIRNTTYGTDSPIESYWAAVALSDLYNGITADNYQSYNSQFDNYYNLLTNARTNGFTEGRAYNGGKAVNDYQKWWDSIGGHTASFWEWGQGYDNTGDNKTNNQFTGDTYFGNLTYRRAMNFLTADEAAKINENLASKNLRFVKYQSGENGRDYYKIEKINNTDTGTSTSTSSTGTSTSTSSTGTSTSTSISTSLSYTPLTFETPAQRKQREAWSDWAPFTMGLINELDTYANMADLQKQVASPMLQGYNIYALLTSGFNLRQLYEKLKQLLLAQGNSRINNTTNLDDANAISDNMYANIEKINDALNLIEALSVASSKQAVLNAVTINKLTNNQVANNNALVAAAAHNNILNANSQFAARRNQAINQYIADMYTSLLGLLDNKNLREYLLNQKDYDVKLYDIAMRQNEVNLDMLNPEKYKTYTEFINTLNNPYDDNSGNNKRMWNYYQESMGDAFKSNWVTADDQLTDEGKLAIFNYALGVDSNLKSNYKTEQKQYEDYLKLLRDAYRQMSLNKAYDPSYYITNLLRPLWGNNTRRRTLYSKEGGKVYNSSYLKFYNFAETLRRHQNDVRKHHAEVSKMGLKKLEIDLKSLTDLELLLLRSIFK